MAKKNQDWLGGLGQLLAANQPNDYVSLRGLAERELDPKNVPVDPFVEEEPVAPVAAAPLAESAPESQQPMSVGLNYGQKSPSQTALEQMIRGNLVGDIEAQRTGIGNTEDDLAALRKLPKQVDLTPLMAFADSWNGSNLAKNYKRPMSPEERALIESGLQGKLQGQRGSVISNQLKALGSGSSGSMMSQMLRQQGTQNRSDRSFVASQQNRVNNTLMKLDDDIGGEAATLGKLDDAFARNNYQAVYAVLGNFARSVSGEKGVLTDQDILRVMPRNFEGGLTKFLSAITNNEAPTAEFGPNYLNELKALIKIAKERTAQRYLEELEVKQKSYNSLSSFRNLGIDELFDYRKQDVLDKFGSPDKLTDKAKENSVQTKKAVADAGNAPSDAGFAEWKKKKGL